MAINPDAAYVDGVIEICCEHCGKFSEAKRQSAFFCDNKCRSAYHNAKRKRAKDIVLAFHSLQTVIDNMPKKGDSEEWNTLNLMMEKIKSAMWTVET